MPGCQGPLPDPESAEECTQEGDKESASLTSQEAPPDVNRDGPAARRRFTEVSEASEVSLEKCRVWENGKEERF